MRPRVAITTSLGFDDGQSEQRLDLRYVDAVAAAGCAPVLLPMIGDRTLVDELLSDAAMLLMPGGPGLERGLVGELPPELPPTPPRRLESDLLWLNAALGRGLPFLGICYGMQLLNAVRGGTIYADTERQHPGARAHSPKRGATTHPILVSPGTTLARAIGAGRREVNSRHLQSVAEPGQGLEVSARADDGTIEAVESPRGDLIGVQWHPEGLGAEAFAGLLRELLRRRGGNA